MSDEDHRSSRTDQNQANGHEDNSEDKSDDRFDESDASLPAQQGCDSHQYQINKENVIEEYILENQGDVVEDVGMHEHLQEESKHNLKQPIKASV